MNVTRNAISISKRVSAVLGPVGRFWARFYRFLEERAERHIAAWLASLQYKRRYTNPDLIKRYRQRP